MISHSRIASLRSKTEELHTALFYNFSRALLKFPVAVILLSTFDKEGNVWFQLSQPYKEISGMDYVFPAELNFYKKGCPYYANLDGIATIAADDSAQMVTIKFRILKAECFHRKLHMPSMLEAMKIAITTVFASLYHHDSPCVQLMN